MLRIRLIFRATPIQYGFRIQGVQNIRVVKIDLMEKLADTEVLFLDTKNAPINIFSSSWSVISLYGLGCNIVLQLGDLVKGVNGGL